jgi:tetratricopeptide (TPR) repeat protein
MAISLKLFLSFLLIGILLSCGSDEYSDLTEEERTQLSEDIWYKELGKHGFNGSFQGTPKAETLLDQILELDPNNCDALREKSVPYLKRGIPHLWKPLFDKAVACDPIAWQPWRGYLYLYFYRDYDKAIADFNASDTLTPNFIDAPQGQSVNYWRGLAYLGKSDYENSLKYFLTHISAELEEAGEEWIETSTFLYLGIAQYELEDYEQSEINLTKMLNYNYGNSADANYYLALINLKSENYQKAEEHILTAKDNYEKGYYRYRDYIEEIRQIYPSNLNDLQDEIEKRTTTSDKLNEQAEP